MNYSPLQSAGSSDLSEQSGIPLQYLDSGIQIPFGHISSDHLHVCCFDFVAGILLAILPALLLFVRALLPLLVDFSLCSWKSTPIGVDGSCFDGDFGASASASASAVDDEDDDDDCGKDSAFVIIGFDINVSKQMSAHSNAVVKQCPSIRN